MTRNIDLESAVEEAGLPQRTLAARVNDLAHARGVPTSYDSSSVYRWIRGQHPNVPDLVAEVLGSALGRTLSLRDIGFAPIDPRLGLDYNSSLHETLMTVRELWRVEMNVDRRDFLAATGGLGALLIEGSRNWLIDPPDSPPVGRGSLRVGATDVQAVREATAMFGGFFGLTGGGRTRDAFIRHLQTRVAPLLDGSYTGKVGAQLCAAVADANLLAGSMISDCGEPGVAVRYLVQALRLSKAGDDPALGGQVLAVASNMYLHQGEHREALRLVRTADAAGAARSTARMGSILRGCEARALAKLGEKRAAAHAVHLAEQAIARSDEHPAWLDYYDQMRWAGESGQCMGYAGDPAIAVRLLGEGMPTGGGARRQQVFYTIVQAGAYLDLHEVEQACMTATQAHQLGVGLASDLCRTEMDALLARLEAHANHTSVKELTELVRA